MERGQRRSRVAGAFTFIELLIALSVISIAFLPLMRMFAVGMEQVLASRDLVTARYLAQEGMERVKNLGFTEAQLKDSGEVWDPPLTGPSQELNGSCWRVRRKTLSAAGPLEVHVSVFRYQNRSGNRAEGDKSVLELVTLISDLDWSEIEK